MRVIALVLVGTLAAGCAAGAAEEPYAPAEAVSAAAILRKCTGGRLAEYQKGACLDDAAKDLGARLKAEVARKVAAIDAVGSRAPSPGSLAGREDADSWRKAFLAAQKAWEEYDRLHCDSMYDYDYHGGSNAGQFASMCRIRHLVARINEIRG
ncbi:hypothetical protein OPKNFCMD_3772 [Methylobacterium crusticola]|uniref:Lysozyme inhibitor LprI-like N-terminal domain-containing protein n=1 Tax=Methylobacterium crusticola TaxID=1697972 RepID=A0ABQ4R2F9_9HYPH|nr:lysozyme inhibitor LprI family protein [Methylobacterium crusticola]GJD51021.1 hypothetical protein OPKNFCMD_3772 [Methylobacterium crusticola]